uniref:Dr1-associated corepressor n=2 Tax=Tetraselmis sp. GSL018 TaxID=582737 RepID=A0A061RPN9_9CHLO
MKGKKPHPLAARIKRIMQKDDDVGKISQASPLLIARAMELFLQKLCRDMAALATSRGARTVTSSHLK